MKKIIIATFMAFISLGMSAQIIRSTTNERTVKIETPTNDWNHSGFFVNAGPGFLTGDADSEFAVEAGWGYRWHISNGISWEVLRLGMDAAVSDFTETMNLRLTTGVRYDSPRIQALGNRSLYGGVFLGYGNRVASDYSGDGGFAYEIGAGVKLTRRLSLGLFYQGNSDKDCEFDYGGGGYGDLKWGMFGVKIEYQFR